MVYNTDLLNDCETAVTKYLSDLSLGLEWLNREPETKEEELEQFQLKRRMVQKLVEKIEIGKDRVMKVVFKVNVLSLLDKSDSTIVDVKVDVSGSSEPFEKYEGGIYSRK